MPYNEFKKKGCPRCGGQEFELVASFTFSSLSQYNRSDALEQVPGGDAREEVPQCRQLL